MSKNKEVKIKDKLTVEDVILIMCAYLRNERDVYSRVRFDEFDKYLSSNVPQELCNTTSHDQLKITRQRFLDTFIMRVD